MTTASFFSLLKQYCQDEAVRRRRSALEKAISRAQFARTQKLLKPSHYASAFQNALKYAQNSIALMVLQHMDSEQLNAGNDKGYSPLHFAVSYDNTLLTQRLLSRGANPNAQNYLGLSPLFYAIQHNKMGPLEILLHNGARTDILWPGWHMNALHLAVSLRNATAVKILLKHSPDLQGRAGNGRTALHMAASAGYTDMIDVLVMHGADTGARCSLGRTPLHEASFKKHTDCVQRLIELGAPLHVKDNWGRSVYFGLGRDANDLIKQAPLIFAEGQKDRMRQAFGRGSGKEKKRRL